MAEAWTRLRQVAFSLCVATFVALAGAVSIAEAPRGSSAPALLEEKTSSDVKLSAPASSRSVDLGTVRSEDDVIHVFHTTNDTGKRLDVTSVLVSCSCTSATISAATVAAGGQVELVARASTDRFPGPTVVRLRIVGTVGGAPAQFDYEIKMRVAPVIDIGSDSLEFDLGKIDVNNARLRHELTIRRGPHPLRWDSLAVDSDDPRLATSVERAGLDKWHVQISVDPQRRIGPYAANLKFRALNANIDTGYAVSRRVSAVIAGPVRAAPSSWLIGQAIPGHAAEQAIHIIPTGDTDEQAEFLDATPSNPKTIEVVKNPAEKDRFTIRYKPPKTLGPDSGYVDARVTTRSGIYTIRIPYLALVVSPEPAGPTPTLAKPRDADEAQP